MPRSSGSRGSPKLFLFQTPLLSKQHLLSLTARAGNLVILLDTLILLWSLVTLSPPIPSPSPLPLCLSPHWLGLLLTTCQASCSGFLRALLPPNFPSARQLKSSF